MKKWRVPVTWEMCSVITVEAKTLGQAMEKARDRDGVIPIPTDGDYVDGSWSLSCDEEEYVLLYQK